MAYIITYIKSDRPIHSMHSNPNHDFDCLITHRSIYYAYWLSAHNCTICTEFECAIGFVLCEI